VVAQASKVFDLLMSSSELPEKVARNTERFRSRMTAAGFKILGENHPICPVMLGDARLANEIADELLELGIFVIGFSYPVVPQGAARIRVQLSAVHSLEDVDKCVDAFVEVGKKKGVIQ
jgi:glycine C-acetyltransferase